MMPQPRYNLFFLVIIAAVSCSQLVFGNDTKGNHAVWGVGQHSCNGFNTARESHNDAEYRSYLMGYLTAYNTLSADTYSVSGVADINGVLTLIDKFCQKTPTDSYDHALQILVTDLHESRARKPPEGHRWGR
jgi:hypothetical protein